MKIIDFDKKGNVVRFYLGPTNKNDYWGDDWSDKPYEENAGSVYDRFVTGIIDIAFPFDYSVFEPADSYWNQTSNCSKEDLKNEKLPCIVVSTNDDDYYGLAASKSAAKFFFNEMFNGVIAKVKRNNGKVLKFVKTKYNEDTRTLIETINLMEDYK